jgi:hypothetical protein
VRVRVALVVLAVVALPGAAWARARAVRHDVERHAGAVASQLTHRHIDVHCPGPLHRRLYQDVHEGEVRFDADGVPADATSLAKRTCDGLRDVIHRGAAYDFACLATSSCSAEEERAAEALAVLTHETMHLRGTMDEAITECQATKRVAEVAVLLGIAPAAAARLEPWQATTWRALLPSQYQGGRC